MPAAAQVGPVIHLEVGGARMLSTHQRETLGYDNGITGMARPGIRIADVFGVELSVGALWFPSMQGMGSVFLAGGGVRFEPMLGRVGRLVVDGHASYGYTGVLSRFALDVGLMFEFRATDSVGLGPYVRYTHLFASGPSDGEDAMMISYGLSLSIGESASHPGIDTDGDGFFDDVDLCVADAAGPLPDPARLGCPLADADHDGIRDRDDVCPNEAQGRTPDPERSGCPLLDTDGDGVYDRDDLCAHEPQGDRPDPARMGCPLSDADGDGVFDPDDACPTTAQGPHPDPARPGCPDGDDDDDGVLNADDLCRTEHQFATFHPDPDRLGCPLADRDLDTVPDVTDACPDVPGAPSASPRRNGCPGLVRVYFDRIDIEQPVYFATGRDTILPRSRAVLTALAEALSLTDGIRRISIEGHTDDIGTEEANLDLSTRRAASVMQWLIAHGIDASRLEAHGFGESTPIAEGTSRAAREENRRVGFRVIDPAAAPANEGGPS
jgi:outer membrane protein OmpA-like peptidoglycan-associated protein